MDARKATAVAGDLGKYDPSFDLSEPEAYRRDVPNVEVHLLDAGHFALDTKADEIAALIGQFVKTQKCVLAFAKQLESSTWSRRHDFMGKGFALVLIRLMVSV